MDLATYYDNICEEPILTKEEEFELFLLLDDPGLPRKERDKIREQIIKANLRFVFKQAKKYSKNDPEQFSELISAGNEGLLVGLNKFDYKKGYRFLTYAGSWVLQRILKEMSKVRITALPIWKQQLASKIQKIVDQNENVTIEDLKRALPDVAEKDIREMYSTKYLTFYIEDLKEDDPGFEIDPIGDEVETRIDRERIQNMVNTLPSPHREIVSMSFGIGEHDEMTHAEISAKLKISKDQVREYKAEGLGILKDKLAGLV
jgi:RNA polymerase sigma factor (sigma-70 family)